MLVLLKIEYEHFVGAKNKRQVFDHVSSSFRYSFHSWISFLVNLVYDDMNITSSANSNVFDCFKVHIGMSLMKKVNNLGLKTAPCGHPHPITKYVVVNEST